MRRLLKKSMKDLLHFSHPDVLYDEDDVKIIRSTLDHASYLQHHLRQTDVRECMIHGSTPWRALHTPLTVKNAETWTGIYQEVPVCMFGTVPLVEDNDMRTALIWMLGTDTLNQKWRKFLRLSRPVSEYLIEGYDLVENVVPIDHTRTIQWLSWLGFIFGDTPTMINGFECVRFVRCAFPIKVRLQ